MNQIETLMQEIEELKKAQQQEYLKAQQKYLEYQKEIKNKTQFLEQLIPQNYSSPRTKPFELFEKAPTLKTLINFEMRGWVTLPYYVGGIFNVKELAELIKQIYQFENKEKYEILVTGLIDQEVEVIRKDIIHRDEKTILVPKLYVIIGKHNLIRRFENINGHFISSSQFSSIKSKIEHAHGKDLITFTINETKNSFEALDIQCFTGNIEDKLGYINYYDYLEKKHESCLFNKQQRIIISNLSELKLNGKHHFKYNNDLLNFEIYQEDKFIGDILTSICIYKKRNNIYQLNREDYNHIFNTLYGQNVDIISLAQADFPTNLDCEDYTRTL